MKILTREEQQSAFKELVEVLKFLAKIDGMEATDAIISAFKIADIVGVHKDLDRISGVKEEADDYRTWTDNFYVRSILGNHNYKHRGSLRKSI